VDGSGDVFVADSGSNVIREVRADHILATVAGTGARGFSGDGGAATSASLFGPVAVAVSADGSLYIADTNNNRVRKIDHGGNIVTIAGDGTAGYAGDGGPATRAQLNEPRGLAFDSAGNLYIADSVNNRIRKVASDGTISTVAGDGNPETLRGPSAIVASAGTLYIADTGNHRIRKMSLGSE
jgi:sugar lactone lactonase YvrE